MFYELISLCQTTSLICEYINLGITSVYVLINKDRDLSATTKFQEWQIYPCIIWSPSRACLDFLNYSAVSFGDFSHLTGISLKFSLSIELKWFFQTHLKFSKNLKLFLNFLNLSRNFSKLGVPCQLLNYCQILNDMWNSS